MIWYWYFAQRYDILWCRKVYHHYQFYILQGKISAKEQKSSASLHHCLAADEVETVKEMCSKSFKIKACLKHTLWLDWWWASQCISLNRRIVTPRVNIYSSWGAGGSLQGSYHSINLCVNRWMEYKLLCVENMTTGSITCSPFAIGIRTKH